MLLLALSGAASDTDWWMFFVDVFYNWFLSIELPAKKYCSECHCLGWTQSSDCFYFCLLYSIYIFFFSFKIPFGWFWLRFYPDFVSRVLGNFYFFSVCQWPAFLVAIIKDDYKNSNNRLTVKRARCRTMNSLGFVSFQVSLIPYFQRGNWGSELRSNLPRVAELRKSSVGIPT